MQFELESDYKPTGDQPQAIQQLVEGKENVIFESKFEDWFDEDFDKQKKEKVDFRDKHQVFYLWNSS